MCQGLRLHLDYSGKISSGRVDLGQSHADSWAAAYSTVAAGAALVAGFGLLAYLKRAGT